MLSLNFNVIGPIFIERVFFHTDVIYTNSQRDRWRCIRFIDTGKPRIKSAKPAVKYLKFPKT